MEASTSANEPDHLEFFGKDSTECESFIATVTKYAYDQGKQRDDEWIADFVGTCMRQSALRWWAGLDEETQGSWKLLRNELSLRYGPIFSGESGEEAEAFVFSIRQRARDVGKLGDPQWIASFASPFFAENALRWYASLQLDVQKNWDALQRAIFAQYPRETTVDGISRIVPTAPSATVIVHPFKARRRGRVKLVREGSGGPYYVSKTRSSSGFLLVEDAPNNALEVEYREDDDSGQARTLFIPDNQVSSYDVLGIKWNARDSASSSSAGLCPINSSSGLGSWDGNDGGHLVTNAWKISSTSQKDVSLSAINGSGTLFARSGGAGGGVGFSKNTPTSNAVSIVFEPM